MTSPILFLIFNRPDTTTRVFAAIRQARPARLYVAADGPRKDREGEAERCAEARRVATDVDWPCEVFTLFRDENLGCRRAVSGAVTWFFEQEEEGVILEDDCLPDPSFFPFCTTLLERYRDNPRIMCITGNNFQHDMGGWPHSYYYSIHNHIWGWASWRRAWNHYDAELDGFENAAARLLLRRLSRVPGFVDYWSAIFERAKRGEIDTWDYQWAWSCWANGGLTCTPRTNLVSNIGFGPSATHTTSENSALANLPASAIEFPLRPPPRIEASVRFDDHVARTVFGIGPGKRKRGFLPRMAHRVGRLRDRLPERQ